MQPGRECIGWVVWVCMELGFFPSCRAIVHEHSRVSAIALGLYNKFIANSAGQSVNYRDHRVLRVLCLQSAQSAGGFLGIWNKGVFIKRLIKNSFANKKYAQSQYV